jgi:hypothetical protein
MKKSHKIAYLSFLLILITSAIYYVGADVFVQKNSEKPEYAAKIELQRKEYTATEGESIEVKLTIENHGKVTWNPTGQYPYLLSYHLLGKDKKVLKFDNRRFSLPGKVEPAQTITMKIILISPLDKGEYILEFDLLREGLAWFRDYGSRTKTLFLTVKEKKWPEDKFALTLDYGKYTKFSSNIEELDKIQKLLRLTLEKNEVEFEGKTGTIKGFSAGTNYPQIWLRDANTMIPISRYYYDRPYLISWLEEHLAFQKENGSLEDWVDSLGNSDKNTTETDQEASAVQAAYQIFEIVGKNFLEKTVNRKKIIDRLDDALNYVFQNRYHKDFGLTTGAHTADWGDVDLIDEGKQAVYVDDRTHWTADIYDQSMVYQACCYLTEMFNALGNADKVSYWKGRAALIKKNTERWLWQANKGFYRVHMHLDSLHHDFNEDDIFAMGGNTQAVISGLADEKKSRQIIENALERQKTFGISTISATLLPPYPAGFFRHPLLDDPYEYQNGAQWDWFGGRLIYTMFEHGFSRFAEEKLMEIIRKNLANRSFFEWDNKEGVGYGSDNYCGSAGSLGRALFEGYLGIKLGRDNLSIEPKLGKNSAKLHVYLPANDIFIAYDYIYDRHQKVLIMQFNSNARNKGTLKLLLSTLDMYSAEQVSPKGLVVELDGKRTPFQLTHTFNDLYLTIDTDFRNHTVKIYQKE